MEVSGRILIGVAAAALSTVSGAQGTAGRATQSAAKQAPRFTVELMWPKPLPTHQLMGSAVGVAVDAQDHVFVVHRIDSFTARTETGADATPPIAECCVSAPPVLEFDATGKLVNSWGGPGAGYSWPAIPSGIAIDPKGNVWIGGSGGLDGQVLVFTHDGKFIRQIGKAGSAPVAAPPAGRGAGDTAYAGVSPGARGAAPAAPAGGRGGRGGRGGPPPMMPPNSTSNDTFGGATRISFDASGSTAYIADGTRNRRVVAVDAATGAVRMFWGAYGKTPSDAATPPYAASAAASQSFSGVMCAEPSTDGMIYVCDRGNNRIQVFKTDGSFVKEATIAGTTLGEGSVWDIAFSRDAAQRFIYVADGSSHKVRILDRASLAELTNFGNGGRLPGTFYAVQGVATDSKGNLYTVETYDGKRVQKFTYKGVGPVTKMNQGVLWPAVAK